MATTQRFDIAPFALPNTPANEVCFEQARDVVEVVVHLRQKVVGTIGLSYRKKHWPQRRFEQCADLEDPGAFGWQPMDDWFNGEWRAAAVELSRGGTAARPERSRRTTPSVIRFQPLSKESYDGDWSMYDVRFRRTLAIRVDGVLPEQIDHISVYSASRVVRSPLHIQLDVGRKTPSRNLSFEAYNATVLSQTPIHSRECDVLLEHLAPANPYVGDDGHLTLNLDCESFTLSLADLHKLGPVWFADQGVFVTLTDKPMTFEEYRARHQQKTILQRVVEKGDHSFAGAFYGQARGHSVNFNIGCMHSPQRFRIEPTGDVLLDDRDVNAHYRHRDAEPRYRAKGKAEFFFGLERWICDARFMDPSPVPISNLHLHNGTLACEQRAVCVPVMRSILKGELTYHEPTVALIRFRFRNNGDSLIRAELPLTYTEEAGRYWYINAANYRIPKTTLTTLAMANGKVTSTFNGKRIFRAMYEGNMKPDGQAFVKSLKPGESCELVVKIPFLDLDTMPERKALASLNFEKACRDTTTFWRREIGRGSTLNTPIPQLNAVYASHAAYVEFSDNVLKDDPSLITTSVGTSTYPNFINEACMIIQELDQRGFTDGVKRRLQVYVEGQGEGRQPGNFTDFDGSYFGAKGWECGAYNQHHGWALWSLAEHHLLTRDKTWFLSVADSVVKGADWVFRQRRNTMKQLPHSRGWEKGFLPAGSLEDVEDFYYWLSTNVLTWRGTDSAARALEAAGHPEAARVRKESDAYRRDLIRGLETNRKYAPVVKLRDGRWVPHYPSRLYCRGRDIGWIREVLEGAVYLLIAGLYDPQSKQAEWILNDYQDNLLNGPPYGYVIRDLAQNFWSRGGFSMQPNLLANLMPHLDRDEVEIYLWIFFNAFASCYREEVNGMVEHPLPELGFDNSATIKTSDEANSVMWLRYMMVYSTPEYLHLGRAIPRAWFKNGEVVEITRVKTHCGDVDARWESQLAKGELIFEGNLRGPQDAKKTWVRFRHPEKAAIKSVTVNGKRWKRFDAAKGDVEISGLKGRVKVVARY